MNTQITKGNGIGNIVLSNDKVGYWISYASAINETKIIANDDSGVYTQGNFIEEFIGVFDSGWDAIINCANELIEKGAMWEEDIF